MNEYQEIHEEIIELIRLLTLAIEDVECLIPQNI